MALLKSYCVSFLFLLASFSFSRANDECQELFFAEKTEHLSSNQQEFVTIDEITRNITVKLNALTKEEVTIDLFTSRPDRLFFELPVPDHKHCFGNSLHDAEKLIDDLYINKYTYGRHDSNCSLISSWVVNKENNKYYSYHTDFGRCERSLAFFKSIQHSLNFFLDDRISLAYVQNKTESDQKNQLMSLFLLPFSACGDLNCAVKSLTAEEYGKTSVCDSFSHVVPFTISNKYIAHPANKQLTDADLKLLSLGENCSHSVVFDGSVFKLQRDPSTIPSAVASSKSLVEPQALQTNQSSQLVKAIQVITFMLFVFVIMCQAALIAFAVSMLLCGGRVNRNSGVKGELQQHSSTILVKSAKDVQTGSLSNVICKK